MYVQKIKQLVICIGPLLNIGCTFKCMLRIFPIVQSDQSSELYFCDFYQFTSLQFYIHTHIYVEAFILIKILFSYNFLLSNARRRSIMRIISQDTLCILQGDSLRILIASYVLL